MNKIVSVNPSTGTVNEEFKPYDAERVNGALKRSKQAFGVWSRLDVSQRCRYLENVASVLHARREEFARTITLEMGKPVRQAMGEVSKCAAMFEYFAKHAESILEPREVGGVSGSSYCSASSGGPKPQAASSVISFEPMGTVLAIKPWNFPFWQVLSAASHILAGGNVMLLKHSSNVPLCALKIEEVFAEAGLDEGVFQTLLIDGDMASSLIGKDGVDAVSFTGSLPAGREVAHMAGYHMKKCVLELGGSDPFIVMEDADIEKAAKVGVSSRFLNTGQTCISSKRFIVQEDVLEEFTSLFCEKTAELVMGDPFDPKTDIGSLVGEGAVKEIEGQVEDGLLKGAHARLSGGRIKGPGSFYAPVVLTSVNSDMKVMKEETFGPVAPIIGVDNAAEAIKLANDTEFGLGASVWSRDLCEASRIASGVKAGVMGINGFFRLEADMPFGGVKKSGIGRELSEFGFYEFMDIKSSCIY